MYRFLIVSSFAALIALCFISPALAEKLYVVERERAAIAVIEVGKPIVELGDLGNMNHATVRFDGTYAYVISRDGYFSKIDTSSGKLTAQAKVGKSGIGFAICGNITAIANYDPTTVVFADTAALKTLKTVETGSRNVGIKCVDGLFVFSLMDKDEIWLYKAGAEIERVAVVKTKSEMPFDALLSGGNTYIAGFFRGGLGLLDLKSLRYEEKPIEAGDETVFKIPHFGTWGIAGSRAYIPAVGQRKLNIIDMAGFRHTGGIALIGLPVFAVVSPDGRRAAVNYSGDMEDYITIVDIEGAKVLKDIKAGRRIMHLRFSANGKTLYASSYFENMLKGVDMEGFGVSSLRQVPTPSGIFICPVK
jgi:protein NirF